tara:strand:- start:188 stop:523 length:336 start_codon:yes stop_codon:yes gene_type:complete
MAVYVHNIIINQGADFNVKFDIEAAATGDYLNLVGYAASAQLRKTHSSSTAVSFAATVASGLDGEVRLSLDSTETANIKPGRYVYDVTVTDPTETIRLVEGSALVRAGVTR